MPPVSTANITTFNGIDLHTINGLTVLGVNAYVPAKRNLVLNHVARTNREKINSAFYNKRSVAVHASISRATRDLAESSFDSLMAIIQGVEKSLVVRQSGGSRKYTCAFADIIFKIEGGAYLEFDLFFETSDHFGYDNALTLLTQISAFTSGQKTTQITVDGSAPWQVPYITLTLTAVGGGTSKAITFGNDATGQNLVITRTWAAGDKLEISAADQTVKVNGTDVAFTGAIPEWAPGTQYISYSDTFTSRTFSLRMDYYRRWI